MPNAFTHEDRHVNPPYCDGIDALTDGQFDPIADIVDFHTRFGLTHTSGVRVLTEQNNHPGDETAELLLFRSKCLKEEADEYHEALEDPNPHNQLDSLVDLVYFALGTAYLQGFDFAEAWNRVHRANMAKVRAERADQSKRGSTFDVVKPEGWQPADLSDLVAPQIEELERLS